MRGDALEPCKMSIHTGTANVGEVVREELAVAPSVGGLTKSAPYALCRIFLKDFREDISVPSRGGDGDRSLNVHRNHHTEDAEYHDAQEGRELDGALRLELSECVPLAV